MSSNPPSLRSATHIALDHLTSERLVEIGATNVVRASDRLIIGPSRRDVMEHARARKAWWCSPEDDDDEGWDQLYSPEVHWAPPVVLWVSTSLQVRVNLWRTCSWLRHLGIAEKDVLILEFDRVAPIRAPERPRTPFECSASAGQHPDEILLERLAEARPWPRERYEHAVSLWNRYVDADPVHFVETCLRGVEGFPELAPLWAFLSHFFPRKTPEGFLRLSRFDELLLTILSTEWQTAVTVFVHKSDAGEELRQLLACAGDLFLQRRLDHWVDHGSITAVEREEDPKPGLSIKSFVYRITERGRQLRDAGLEGLADAPSLPMAGTEAYALSAPWVVLDDGRLARW